MQLMRENDDIESSCCCNWKRLCEVMLTADRWRAVTRWCPSRRSPTAVWCWVSSATGLLPSPLRPLPEWKLPPVSAIQDGINYWSSQSPLDGSRSHLPSNTVGYNLWVYWLQCPADRVINELIRHAMPTTAKFPVNKSKNGHGIIADVRGRGEKKGKLKLSFIVTRFWLMV